MLFTKIIVAFQLFHYYNASVLPVVNSKHLVKRMEELAKEGGEGLLHVGAILGGRETVEEASQEGRVGIGGREIVIHEVQPLGRSDSLSSSRHIDEEAPNAPIERQATELPDDSSSEAGKSRSESESNYPAYEIGAGTAQNRGHHHGPSTERLAYQIPQGFRVSLKKFARAAKDSAGDKARLNWMKIGMKADKLKGKLREPFDAGTIRLNQSSRKSSAEIERILSNV